jgi:hypothetical protein
MRRFGVELTNFGNAEPSRPWRRLLLTRPGSWGDSPRSLNVHCRPGIVPHTAVRFDGETGGSFELIEGHVAYSTFRIGKRKAGQLLDGQEWKEFPKEVLKVTTMPDK